MTFQMRMKWLIFDASLALALAVGLGPWPGLAYMIAAELVGLVIEHWTIRTYWRRHWDAYWEARSPED